MSRSIVSTDIGVLPAFVVGYQGAYALPEDAPEWVTVVEHQFGGYCCYQEQLTGCVLRLHTNQDQGTGKLWLLARALVELGESWPGGHEYSARETRELKDRIIELCGVGAPGYLARPMEPEEAQQLGELFREHLHFAGLTAPMVESGSEALVTFTATNPLPFFDHWRVARAIPCGDYGEAAWREHVRYDGELQEWMMTNLGGGELPRIFLLWENID